MSFSTHNILWLLPLQTQQIKSSITFVVCTTVDQDAMVKSINQLITTFQIRDQ